MFRAIVIDCPSRRYWLINGRVDPSQGKQILTELIQHDATVIFVSAEAGRLEFHQRMLEIMGFQLDQSNKPHKQPPFSNN